MEAIVQVLSDAQLLALAGLLGGGLLGLAARLGRFCALGAIEDVFFAQDSRRARMWAVAMAVAVAGFFLLEMRLGDALARNFYLGLGFNPLASIVGGVMFGYGMALVGTCGFGALARIGGGDFRGLVVAIVIGVTAYMALKGPLAELRLILFAPSAAAGPVESGLAHAAAAGLGLESWMVGLCVAGALAALACADLRFLSQPSLLVWGVVAGAAVISGWAATYWIAEHAFAATAIRSHSFVAPTGESLVFLMTSHSDAPSFGAASVFGVIGGAAVGSLWRGEFRWEACDDARELSRQIGGAALMGVGGVVALGCTVGQGLTALSCLTLGAPITIGCIVLGAWLGLNHLIVGMDQPKSRGSTKAP